MSEHVVVDGAPRPVRRHLELLEEASLALARLVGDAGTWSSRDRRDALAAVERASGVLSAVRGQVLVAVRDAQDWRGSGDASLEAWHGRTSRSGVGVARRQVRQAEAAASVPAMRAAVVEGSVTAAHLDALGTVVGAAPVAVQRALAEPSTQAELVDAARRLDARAFATSAARLAARLDPLAHERSHQAQRAARFVHLADTPDGTRISGQFDRMAGHRLRLALEAVTPRPAADDERSAEQRRADALDVLAEKVLNAPETTSGAAVRPHISFQMTAETWAGLRALGAARIEGDGGRAVMDGKPVGTPAMGLLGDGMPGPGALLVEPVTLDDGTPVPLNEVARALCDCELTRIVVGADGAVLDLGRTQRTYTGVQRRAVVTRDQGCGWNGCSAPARWCEVHHIRWWDRDGGATSIDNGILLCSFHHHEVHRRELAIERVPRDPGAVGDRRAGVRYVFRDASRRVVSAPRVVAAERDAEARLQPDKALVRSGPDKALARSGPGKVLGRPGPGEGSARPGPGKVVVCPGPDEEDVAPEDAAPEDVALSAELHLV